MKYLIAKLLPWLARKFDGKKTTIGGVSGILLGLSIILSAVVGLVGYLYPDLGLPQMDVDTFIATLVTGWASVAAGFATLGIGGKVDKLKEAVAASQPAPPAP